MSHPFKLEPVLTQRRFHEDNLQQAFVHLQQKAMHEKQMAQQLRQQRQHASESLKEHLAASKPVGESVTYVAYLNGLDQQIFEQEKVVVQTEKEKQEKRQALVEAAKSRKMVERLKEMHTARRHRDELKKEQDGLDEMGIRLHTQHRMP